MLKIQKAALLTLFSLFLINCGGGGSDNTTPPPTPPPVQNSPPSADAGADQTVNEQTEVTLNGSGTDSDGSISSYSWSQVSGVTVSLSNNSVAAPTFVAPTTKEILTLEFELTVTDNDGATGSDRVIITVEPVNSAPTANAGADQTVNEQTEVTLNGSGTDSDGSISSYSWSQVSGVTVSLNDNSVAAPTFAAPTTKEILTVEFELTVTDDNGATDSDRVIITVEPVNSAPVANAGADQTVDEQTEVTLNGSGTDSDGSISSYSWSQVSGVSVTLNNHDQANVNFIAPIAKETLELEFEFSVTDDEGASASNRVVITVNPVNEISFSVKGKISTGTINNVEILASVSEIEVVASTGENGTYEVLIEVDEDFANQLLAITATGTVGSQNVKLVSILGALEALNLDAGEDKILTSNENHLVNISNVTTAIAGHLNQINSGILPVSIDDYNNLIALLDAVEMFNAALAIQMIVDYGESNAVVALPNEVTDTFELVSNEEYLRSYYESFGESERTTYYEPSKGATLSNNEIKASDFILPESYTWVRDFGVLSGEKFTFDGALGSYIAFNDGSIEQSMDVSSNANQVELYPEGTPISSSTVFREVNGVFQQVVVESIHDKIDLSLLLSTPNFDLVTYKVTTRQHYPNGEFLDEIEEFSNVRLMAKGYVPFKESELIGQIMLPLENKYVNRDQVVNTSFGPVETELRLRAEKFTLTDDGIITDDRGEIELGNSGTWSLVNGILYINFSPGKEFELKKLRDNTVAVTSRTPDNELAGFIVSDYSLKSSSWSVDSIPGIYDLDIDYFDPYNNFWLDLREDNTGQQVSTLDVNNNGVLEDNEFFIIPIFWKLESGKVIVERYYSLTSRWCEVVTADCYLMNKRTMDLMSIDGDRYYLTNRHQFALAPITYNSLDPELTSIWTSDSTVARKWIKLEQPKYQVPVIVQKSNRFKAAIKEDKR